MKKILAAIIGSRITLFIFAFAIMAFRVFPLKDLYGGSGDAVETWKVVTSFFAPNPEHSYVMYKGLLAFVHNIACFQLSLFFRTEEFFFLRIFNCLGFAYVATVGIPYFFSYIFNKKIEIYKIYILTILLYFGIGIYFTYISVDFPSITVMFLTLNSVIRIAKAEKKLPLVYYIYTGVVFSACVLFSGQYLPAAVCGLLFIVFAKLIPMLKNKEFRLRFIAVLALLTVGFYSVSYANDYFVKTRVQPVRDAGEWLPEGKAWFKSGLTVAMLMSKYPANIPDNRGKAILTKENADLAEVEKGGAAYSFRNYAKLVLKYPFDFLMRWLNRLFLGISVDNYTLSVTYLFFSYTLLFLSLLTLKRCCKTAREVFSSKTFLILALITVSLVPCLLRIEMRYMMSVDILIAGTAILSDTLWKSLKDFWGFILKIIHRNKSGFKWGDIHINYSFVSYVIFITLCFMLFATQNELTGFNPVQVLFTP